VIGPSFSAVEVPEVIDALLSAYLDLRTTVGERRESFVETVRRAGIEPFRTAADRVRSLMETTA
jgi:sulfite reductase (NADPH) hemoprotein beta-component